MGGGFEHTGNDPATLLQNLYLRFLAKFGYASLLSLT